MPKLIAISMILGSLSIMGSGLRLESRSKGRAPSGVILVLLGFGLFLLGLLQLLVPGFFNR